MTRPDHVICSETDGGFDCALGPSMGGADWFEMAFLAFPIMHMPRAHMIRQGAVATISGAMPTAVSQSQPSASPVPPSASPATARTRRLPSQDRTTSGGNVAVEQHDATAGLGAEACGLKARALSGSGVEGAGAGFMISNVSIIASSFCTTGSRHIRVLQS